MPERNKPEPPALRTIPTFVLGLAGFVVAAAYIAIGIVTGAAEAITTSGGFTYTMGFFLVLLGLLMFGTGLAIAFAAIYGKAQGMVGRVLPRNCSGEPRDSSCGEAGRIRRNAQQINLNTRPPPSLLQWRRVTTWNRP